MERRGKVLLVGLLLLGGGDVWGQGHRVAVVLQTPQPIEGLDRESMAAELVKAVGDNSVVKPVTAEEAQGVLGSPLGQLAELCGPNVECLSLIGENLKISYLVLLSLTQERGAIRAAVSLVDVGRKMTAKTYTETYDGALVGLSSFLVAIPGRIFPSDLLRHPDKGTLVLETKLEGAAVHVDGERLGSTPQVREIKLSPGHHIISVARPGFQGLVSDVEIKAGIVSNLTVALMPLPEVKTIEIPGEQVFISPPWYKRWWVWTSIGAAAAVAVAVPLAVFLSGGEQLPPGNLGTVTIPGQ